MSNELIVQPIAVTRKSKDAVGEGRKVVAQPAAPPEHVAARSPIPNPTLRLDPALGLVVIEFRNHTGAITTSIPSQRQLQAYQKWDMTGSGSTFAVAPPRARRAAPEPAGKTDGEAPPTEKTDSEK
jgi:hypothetical protein